ncbi:TatD family hydrolase [Candidatus Kaiserbacteria bacterium]|nr:MAG: TatD family hydrolase [Candidatus Kaiserbacteria bacterium]
MTFRYIDIHTHLNLDAFDVDGEEVGERTRAEGVAYINIGTGKATSEKAVALAHEAEGVFATVGMHPTHTSGEHAETFEYEDFRSLARNEKVVAIGECGLDYFRVDKEMKGEEEAVFLKHIQLANEVGKPLMLHIRPSEGSMDAYHDALRHLKAHAKVLGNVHFFAGTYAVAKQFWDIGFTTSFTGVITFASQYDEVIKNAPLAMLHAETDAPYVAPVPYRGKRNEPRYVKEVYKRIATIRGEDEEKVRCALLENARRVFGATL